MNVRHRQENECDKQRNKYAERRKDGKGERRKHSITIKQAGIQTQGEVSRGVSCQKMKHEQEPYRTHLYFSKESNRNISKKAKQKIKSHTHVTTVQIYWPRAGTTCWTGGRLRVDMRYRGLQLPFRSPGAKFARFSQNSSNPPVNP